MAIYRTNFLEFLETKITYRSELTVVQREE